MLLGENFMNEKGMYFASEKLYQLIKDIGGTWNDSKERPIVCLIKSTEHEDLYWAIPVGNYTHRDNKAQQRIQSYLNLDESNIASCYYHVGNTTTKSIFFISDTIPITKKYINREYLGYDEKQYVLKNAKLLAELERKLKRILAFENGTNNHFRQHITDIKNELLKDLD